MGNAQVGSAVLAASHSAAVVAFAQLGLTPATYMTVQPVTLGQPELQKGAPEAGASRTPIATSRVSGGGRAIGAGSSSKGWLVMLIYDSFHGAEGDEGPGSELRVTTLGFEWPFFLT